MRMFIGRLLLTLQVLVAPSAPAQVLTLAEARELAARNQPRLASQQAAADAARELVAPESALPDPKLKLGLNNVPINGPDSWSLTRDPMTQRTVAVEQVFPDQQKRQLRGERAGLEAELGAAELENQRRALRRDAALAWLNVYYPLRAIRLLDEALGFYERQKQAAEIALRAGRGAAADVHRVQVEAGLQRDRRLEMLAQSARARAELARWIGAAAHAEIGGAPDERPAPPLDVLRARVLEHPQLAAAHREIALADNDVRQARAAFRPDWSLEVGYAARGSGYGDMVSVLVGIELPLFTTHRQDRRLASRISLKEKHEQQHEAHRRALLAEVESAHVAWESLNTRVTRFDRDVLPEAARRADAAVVAYQGGRGDLAAALEARRAELDLRLQRLALEADRARAREAIHYLAAGRE
ncbi:MAG: TolC family protein [Burkholderiales bacterium]|nr:TolC family protein [Burkholderiales bacterium]